MMRRKLILLPAFLSMLAAAPGLAAESQSIKPVALHVEAKPQIQVVASARALLEEEKAKIEGKHVCFRVIAGPVVIKHCMGSRRRWPHIHH